MRIHSAIRFRISKMAIAIVGQPLFAALILVGICSYYIARNVGAFAVYQHI